MRVHPRVHKNSSENSWKCFHNSYALVLGLYMRCLWLWPNEVYLLIAVDVVSTWLWPEKYWTKPAEIFYEPCRLKLKNEPFWGKSSWPRLYRRRLTQPEQQQIDPIQTRLTKFSPNPNQPLRLHPFHGKGSGPSSNTVTSAKRGGKFINSIMARGKMGWRHMSVYHLIFCPYQWSKSAEIWQE